MQVVLLQVFVFFLKNTLNLFFVEIEVYRTVQTTAFRSTLFFLYTENKFLAEILNFSGIRSFICPSIFYFSNCYCSPCFLVYLKSILGIYFWFRCKKRE